MKRSEMLEHLQEELAEFFESMETASTKRRLHVIRNKADGILAFMEGFGMLPPFSSEAAKKSTQIDAPGYEWDEEE